MIRLAAEEQKFLETWVENLDDAIKHTTDWVALRRKIKPNDMTKIEKQVVELATTMIAAHFEDRAARYVHVPTWKEHQTEMIKNKIGGKKA